jgi:GH35 family endo-1,4-beta-xylanase
MKYFSKILLVVSIPIIAACADGAYDSGIKFERPEDVDLDDYLNSYHVLNSYINRTDHPNFKLGIGMSLDDFSNKDIAYSLACSNFDEVTPSSGLTHASGVNDDGSLNVNSISNFVAAAKSKNLSVFGHSLCGYAGQNVTYLNSIIAPIPGDEHPGTTKLADFDNDALGTIYKLSGSSGTATVVADPAGKNGNVLHISGASYDSYAVIPVTLPEGVTLANCKYLLVDIKAPGSGGLYGMGMNLRIGDSGSYTSYGSPASFGCQDGAWGYGLIRLDMSQLNLTSDQKSLNSFNLVVGSKTGKANYYIDNIKIEWATGEPPYYYTLEQKRDTLTKAMDKWIKGVMQASNGYIKAWDVVNEPMSDNDNYTLRYRKNESDTINKFFWPDYLGDNYVQVIAKDARQYFKQFGGDEKDLKLFVNDYGLENPSSTKLSRLLKMINQWESDGITRIDGIGIELHLTYSLDPTLQNKNEENIASLFQKLKTTGKLIRISELEMGIVDQYGTAITSSDITFEQQLKMSEFYNFIIRKYYEVIPVNQQYGITLWNAMDKVSGLWDGTVIRNATYMGFADGLANKNTISVDSEK